jgi:hypothetical protein
MNYMLCTGRYSVSEEWHKIWLKNTDKGRNRCTIEVGATSDCFNSEGFKTQFNLGHVHDLIPGKSDKLLPHEFCGWSAGVIAGVWLCYVAGKDAMYKEQDTLCFGDWDNAAYEELGSGKFIFGRKHRSAPWMPCGQSFFLMKHDFIPDFVCHYLGMGKDGDVNNLPEHKFVEIEKIFGSGVVKRFSFGYDRERPINFNDRVWYAQKFTNHELEELNRRKMI